MGKALLDLFTNRHVTLATPIVPTFSATSLVTHRGKTITITITSEDLIVTSYIWSFGDSTTSLLKNPIHVTQK
jgi:PKD repeat protein